MQTAAMFVREWRKAQLQAHPTPKLGVDKHDKFGLRIHPARDGVSWVQYFLLDEWTKFHDKGHADNAIDLRALTEKQGEIWRLRHELIQLRAGLMQQLSITHFPPVCAVVTTPPGAAAQTAHLDSEEPGNAVMFTTKQGDPSTECPRVVLANGQVDETYGYTGHANLPVGGFVLFDTAEMHRGPANPSSNSFRHGVFFSWPTSRTKLSDTAFVVFP